MTGRRDRCDLSGHPPAPLSSGWGPPACLVHLGAHGCGRLSRTCTLEYSGGVAGGGGCDERHASGGTASCAGRALLIRVGGSAHGSAPELDCCPRLPSCPHGLLGLGPLCAGVSALDDLKQGRFVGGICCRIATTFPPGGKPRLGRARRGLGERRRLSVAISMLQVCHALALRGEAAA